MAQSWVSEIEVHFEEIVKIMRDNVGGTGSSAASANAGTGSRQPAGSRIRPDATIEELENQTRVNKALGLGTELLKAQIELAEKLNILQSKLTKARKEFAETEAEILRINEEIAEEKRKGGDSDIARIGLLEAQLDRHRDILTNRQKELETSQQQIDNNTELVAQEKERYEIASRASKDLVSSTNSIVQTISRKIGLENLYNSQLLEGAKNLLVLKRSTNELELSQKFISGAVKDYVTNLTGGVKLAELLGFGMQFVATAVGTLLAEIAPLLPLLILIAAAAASLSFAFEQDKQIVAFNQATGAAGKYNYELAALSDNLLSVGITAENQVKSFQALYENVRTFSDLTQDARKEIVDTTSLLDKMGFKSLEQSKNILFLSKSFGMSEQAAAGFNTRLMSLARGLDLPIGKVTGDFEEAKKVLGASAGTVGELATQFGKLEQISKQTNLSVSTMLGIVSKFDTFTSAATQVGRLNALLGGPFLSTIEMVSTTDPAERLKLLVEGVQKAGKSFESMAYYEKKAIADAMGLSDVNDLALALSGNMDLIEPPPMDTQSIIEMKTQMKQFNDVMSEFKNVGMSMVVSLYPLVDVFKAIAQILKIVMPLVGIMLTPIQGVSMVLGVIANYFSSIIDRFTIFFGSENMKILFTVLKVIGSIVGALILAPYLAPLLGFGAAATALSVSGIGATYATYGDDVISPAPGGSGYGQRTLVGPEGAISLNNKDTIVAGTNLVGSSPAASGMAGKFNEATARSQSTVVQQTASPAANGNVNIYLSIDGEEIRTVVNKVKIDPTLSPNLYNSIASLITRGEETR